MSKKQYHFVDAFSSDSDNDRPVTRPAQRGETSMTRGDEASRSELEGRKTWRDQGGGWMTKTKPVKELSESQLQRFSQIYMDDLHAQTGINMSKFKLTRSSQKYVSMFDFARARDRVLSTLFERRPKVWDLHAGSGADSFAYLADLDPQELVLCQRSVQDGERGAKAEESKREYDVMCSNIKDFVRAAKMDALVSVEGEPVLSDGKTQRRVHIKCKHKLAETFIMSVPQDTEVDIVHLDPSWDDDHDIGGKVSYGREMTPHELFYRLEKLIWTPIRLKNIKVGCYVIKTRWNLLKIEQYLEEVKSQFIATYSLKAKPFRPNLDGMPKDKFDGSKGAYYYMVLTHRDYKTIDYQPSQMYWDIIRNGTPVWVKRSTMVGLIRPGYSANTAFPEWTESNPHSEEYVMIKPHSKLSRKGVKGVGPKTPEERTTYNPRKFDPEEQLNESDSNEEEEDDKKEPPTSGRNRYAVFDEHDSD